MVPDCCLLNVIVYCPLHCVILYVIAELLCHVEFWIWKFLHEGDLDVIYKGSNLCMFCKEASVTEAPL